jgi:hypothetical protein
MTFLSGSAPPMDISQIELTFNSSPPHSYMQPASDTAGEAQMQNYPWRHIQSGILFSPSFADWTRTGVYMERNDRGVL